MDGTFCRTSMRTVFTPVGRQVTPHKFKPFCDLCGLISLENNNHLSVHLPFPIFSVIFIFEPHFEGPSKQICEQQDALSPALAARNASRLPESRGN